MNNLVTDVVIAIVAVPKNYSVIYFATLVSISSLDAKEFNWRYRQTLDVIEIKDELKKELYKRLNLFRLDNGLKELTKSTDLEVKALTHSRKMFDSDTL